MTRMATGDTARMWRSMMTAVWSVHSSARSQWQQASPVRCARAAPYMLRSVPGRRDRETGTASCLAPVSSQRASTTGTRPNCCADSMDSLCCSLTGQRVTPRFSCRLSSTDRPTGPFWRTPVHVDSISARDSARRTAGCCYFAGAQEAHRKCFLVAILGHPEALVQDAEQRRQRLPNLTGGGQGAEPLWNPFAACRGADAVFVDVKKDVDAVLVAQVQEGVKACLEVSIEPGLGCWLAARPNDPEPDKIPSFALKMLPHVTKQTRRCRSRRPLDSLPPGVFGAEGGARVVREPTVVAVETHGDPLHRCVLGLLDSGGQRDPRAPLHHNIAPTQLHRLSGGRVHKMPPLGKQCSRLHIWRSCQPRV